MRADGSDGGSLQGHVELEEVTHGQPGSNEYPSWGGRRR